MSSEYDVYRECNSTCKLRLPNGSRLRKARPSSRVDVGSSDEDAPVQLGDQHAYVGPLLHDSSHLLLPSTRRVPFGGALESRDRTVFKSSSKVSGRRILRKTPPVLPCVALSCFQISAARHDVVQLSHQPVLAQAEQCAAHGGDMCCRGPHSAISLLDAIIATKLPNPVVYGPRCPVTQNKHV